MYSGTQVPIFRRNILLPASWYTDYDNNIWYNDGGNVLFPKAGTYLPGYTVSQHSG
jgi:hypothetical protein